MNQHVKNTKIKIIYIKPNTQMIFNINTREKISETKIHTFDLNQHKTNYNDYIEALEKSILKRFLKMVFH